MITEVGMEKQENKYMSSRKNNLENYFYKLTEIYNLEIKFVKKNQLKANAAVIKLDDKNIILINECVPDKLLILVLFHEIAHIKKGYLGDKYISYNKKIERKVNYEALKMLQPFIPKYKYIILIINILKTEDRLYSKFFKLNNLFLEGLVCLKIQDLK